MEQEIKRALAGMSLGPLRYYKEIGSTNTEAERWAAEGAPDLAIVIADQQTNGRGRQGRRWLTNANSALAFSLILKDFDDLNRAALESSLHRLTGLGAVAVCQALRLDYCLDAKIKWPNDVLLNKHKVAGILAESQWQGNTLQSVILGIGVNVKPAAIPPGEELNFPATSVEDAALKAIDRPKLLQRTLGRLLYWRERLNEPAFIGYWQEHLVFRNELVSISTHLESNGQKAIRGVLLGLDPEGRLKLQDQRGRILYLDSGEIQALRAISNRSRDNAR